MIFKGVKIQLFKTKLNLVTKLITVFLQILTNLKRKANVLPSASS